MKNGKCLFESVANLIITFNEKPIELPSFLIMGLLIRDKFVETK